MRSAAGVLLWAWEEVPIPWGLGEPHMVPAGLCSVKEGALLLTKQTLKYLVKMKGQTTKPQAILKYKRGGVKG